MTQRHLIAATILLAIATIAVGPTRAQTQAGQREAPAFAPVTAERLLNAEDEPHNWLMYSGNYMAQRYTRLDQIDRRNVAGLEIAWVYQLAVLDRAETTPLVVDGSCTSPSHRAP